MSLDRDIALLRKVPTFASLSPEALRLLAISAERRTLTADEILFVADEPAEDGYVVMSGRIDLVEARGDHRRVVHTAARGALIGEAALIVDIKRPVSAIAGETTTLMKISRALFLRMLEAFPDAALAVRRSIAGRLRETLGALDGVRVQLESAPGKG